MPVCVSLARPSAFSLGVPKVFQPMRCVYFHPGDRSKLGVRHPPRGDVHPMWQRSPTSRPQGVGHARGWQRHPPLTGHCCCQPHRRRRRCNGHRHRHRHRRRSRRCRRHHRRHLHRLRRTRQWTWSARSPSPCSNPAARPSAHSGQWGWRERKGDGEMHFMFAPLPAPSRLTTSCRQRGRAPGSAGHPPP